jgi:hypothetical protein
MNVSTLHGRLTDKLITIVWHDSGLNGGVSHCPTGGELVLCAGSPTKLLSGPQARLHTSLNTPQWKQRQCYMLLGYLSIS